MMKYRGNHHTALFHTEYSPNGLMRFYTDFTLNESNSYLGDVQLVADPAIPAGALPAYNYANVSDLGTFSDLRVRRLLQTVGMEYRFGERWILQQELWWHEYDDTEPFLFDTNGRNLGARFSINWIF